MKFVELRVTFYRFLFHQQCFFFYESASGIHIGCTAFYVPKIHCFIQFVKFPQTNSFPVTFKSGIVFSNLFIFYYRFSRCFSNIENFSNISTTDRRIACHRAILFFGLAITFFSAIVH